MAGTKEKNKHIALFEGNKVRRVWHDEKWFFSVVDIVAILSESANPRRYWSDLKIKLATEGYSELYEKIVQLKLQSSERNLYEQKGYTGDWVAKRVRGIAVRNTLTDEWNKRGLKKGVEYAILTNEIMQGTFDMKVDDYKKHKNLSVQHNLRDHMGDIELILTMLAEATTTKLSVDRDSEGFNKLHNDAKEGGEIVGKTRREIENRSGKKIATKNNFLNIKSKKKLKD